MQFATANVTSKIVKEHVLPTLPNCRKFVTCASTDQKKKKNTENHTINSVLLQPISRFVGVAGFEPATSASQTRRDNRATLHPEFKWNTSYYYKI